MYDLIAANRRRSALLMIGFILLILLIGWVFGQLTDLGYLAPILALVFAAVMSVTSYYHSDKIVLRMSRAIPASPHEPMQARLINIVEGLSIAAGLPPPRIYVVQDDAPNAFATGRNPSNAAIAVTTGLLGKMNRVELEGVVAHEMSHIRNHDILVSTIAVVLAGSIALLADWLLRGFWRVGDRKRAAPIAGVLGIVIALLAPIVAKMMQMAVSRRRELLADSTAIQLTRYPPGLIDALKKLRDDTTVVRTSSRATAHLWIESPLDRAGGGVGSWLNRLFDTHPPIEERIRILEGI